MQYQYYDLGDVQKGWIVEVTLGYPANVRIMNDANYDGFKKGGCYQYIGGYSKRSPYRAEIPSTEHWHVVIDLGGYGGKVRSAVRILSGRLPEVKNTSEELIRDQKKFDVFLLHTPEDKDSIVRPLAIALCAKGITVKMDEYELHEGTDLKEKINAGIAEGRMGILIVTRSYVNKKIVNDDLDLNLTEGSGSRPAVLPVWHDITKQEVIDYRPALTGIPSKNTAVSTIYEIAEDIGKLLL